MGEKNMDTQPGLEPWLFRDYIIPLLNRDTPLFEAYSKAVTLISIVHSLIQRRIPGETDEKLLEKIRRERETYRKHGVELPPPTRSISDWYLRAVEKTEDDDIKTWIRRVAIASMIIVGDLLVKKETPKATAPETREGVRKKSI